MKHTLYKIGVTSSLLLGFWGCSWDVYFKPSLDITVRAEGLRDTLRVGRDTLTLRASLPQPIAFYDPNQPRRQRNQTLQLSSGSQFYIAIITDHIRTDSNGRVQVDSENNRELLPALPVVGQLKSDRASFDIQSNQIQLKIQFLPKEPGLYVLRLGGGEMDSDSLGPVGVTPSFDVANKNHHLLTEEMKKQVLLVNEQASRQIIAFYVRK